MPNFTAKRTEPHRFVEEGFDPTSAEAVTKAYDQLQARELDTREALDDFIHDWEELGTVLYESYTVAYIDMTVDTTNPAYEEKYLKIVEEVLPIKEQRDFEIKQKLLASPALDKLGPEYDMLLRNIRPEVELFREENVPLLTEERKLTQEYSKIAGAQEAEFRGKTYTLAQLTPFLEETDRETREGAWRARWGAKLKDAPALDALYDRMYEVRQQIARNAGHKSFRDYKFVELRRFDYTPDDCMAFHEAIAKYVVPVVSRDMEERQEQLGVETLRPWDIDVDPLGAEPLRPFDNVGRLEEGCERITRKIDPQLGDFFRQMIDSGLLDLDNRQGKAPGGYCDMLPNTGVPFIFMNAVGTKDDVETLLHEGGHAFHYYLARQLDLPSYHNTTSEFSEVASMSMELLARPYLDEFFSEEELARLLKDQLKEKLRFFPFMSMIDSFQQWMYTTTGDHGAEARKAKWTELEERFRPSLDWTGLERIREIGWQYLHVFEVPFYYIEYGIAQLAALRVWLNSLEDERGAIEAYKRGLALGGSKALPELFDAAGAKFGLNDATVSTIVDGTMAQVGEA
ncbi:MAG: M3 family oligoendopeptidase [Chloroflexota bacterium]